MQEPSLDKWTSLFLFAAVQGLFLAGILFFHKKGNRKANAILATIILLFSIMMIYYVTYWSGYAAKYRWMNGWVEFFGFLFGPLTYIYLQVLEKEKLRKQYVFHFLPAAVNFVFSVPFIIRNIFGRVNVLREYFFNHGWLVDTSLLVLIVFQNISLLAYGIAMHIWLRNDFRKLNAFALPEEVSKHRWLRKIVFLYTGFAMASISYWILVWTGFLKLEYDYLISVAMSVFIYTVGYLGFRQPEIFHGYASSGGKKPELKYARSSLRPEQVQVILSKLLSVMETEKPWLDSELKIQQLAEKAGVSTHHLSQIINEQLNQRYADFISSYRIREAKRLLLSPDYGQEKILSIAFDSGFHNKATFNSAFKKSTGMSPTEFKKYHQKVLVN